MINETIELENYTFKSLVKAVCDYSNIKPEELLGKSRLKMFVVPRHILYYLGYTYTGYTLPKLGSMIGTRDHTTILYGYNKIIDLKRKDADLDLAIKEIHLMALTNEQARQDKLADYRDEVEEMIYRIKMEKLNGLRTETQVDTRPVYQSHDSHVSAAE